jgi:hypothetical protein
MNEPLKKSLFKLVSEPSQKLTNEEIQNANERFTKTIRTNSQSENNYS